VFQELKTIGFDAYFLHDKMHL